MLQLRIIFNAVRLRKLNQHSRKHRITPDSQDIDQEFMEKARLNTQFLPPALSHRAHQALAKYHQKEVRKLGAELKLLLHNLHPQEKPGKIAELPLFADRLDRIQQKTEQIYLSSPQKAVSMKDQTKKQQVALNSQNFVNKSLIDYSQNLVIAHLYKVMPSSFAIACRILTQIKYRYPNQKFKKFLDFGAGLASASYAFSDIFQSSAIFAVQPSPTMTKLGKHLTSDLKNISWMSSVAQGLSNQNFHEMDIVYCGNVLQEVQNATSRLLILESLWLKVRPGGFLVLVEPGTVTGFRYVHDFRRWAIQRSGKIVAPCPHNKQCPLANKQKWCHFDQPVGRYSKQIIAKYPLQKDIIYEKFSYMVVQKPYEYQINVPARPQLPADQELRTLPLLVRVQHWARILFPIMKRGGHFILDLCTKQGLHQRRIISKIMGQAYKRGQKLRWGDLWRYQKWLPNKLRKQKRIKSKRLW